MRSLGAMLAVCLLATAVDAAPVAAQDPYDCHGDLLEEELEARLALVDRRLQAGKRGARAWWYGWQALFGAVFAYQLGSAITATEESARWANSIGTVGSFLALAQMWILPQPAAYAPQRYRRMPTRTREQREAKLAYGLDRLQTAAARQELGRGVLAHSTPLLWSAVWGTTLSIKFDDPLRVALLVVGGFVITQARIWTTPQRAVRDWNQIRWTICEHRYVRVAPEPRETGEANEAGNLDIGETAPNVPDAIEVDEDEDDEEEEEGGPEARVAPFFGGAQLLVTF